MRIRGKMVTGTFQERPNRFLALVRVNDAIVPCFLPNPGRLHELLVPDVKVILKEASKGNRKTPYDLIGVWAKDQKISVDSKVPNQLLLEALRNRELEEFSMYRAVKPEWNFGHTRFDFLLTDGMERCLLEAKSCTLVEGRRAFFPDAPTERGRRHILDLMEARRKGYRACILFLVQRTDAQRFSPNDAVDPEFGRTLRQAATEGVEVYAYSSEFTGDEIVLRGKVGVDLSYLGTS